MARPGPDRPVVSGGDRGAARVPCSPGEHDPGAASQAWIHSPLRRPLRPTDSADLYFFQPFIEIEPSEVAEPVQGGTEPPGPGAATRRPALAGRTNAIVVGKAGAARQ